MTLLAIALFTCAPAAAGEHIGYYARELGGLAQPGAAALAPDGSVLVTEAARGALAVFDAEGALSRRIDLRGADSDGSDALVEPAGVCVAPDGAIYWTDANGARVHALAPDGSARASFGARGLAPGELHRPRGVEASAELVAVADAGNHRVELYTRDGEYVRSLGGFGRGEGELLRPADVAFGPDGRIYVADAGNARVAVFDAEGRFVQAWGDFGPFPGLFIAPSAIEVRAGLVFVCDRGNHRVQVFDTDGALEYEWGEHAIFPLEGEGKLHYPEGLAVSADGEVAVVVEGVDDRCQVFVADEARGTGERLVPRPGAGNASAHYGEELAFGGDWLAITAPEDGTVLVFETSWKEPRLVAHAGERGDATGLFLRPGGLHVDGARGVLTVTDPDQRRVSLLRLSGFEGRNVGYDPFLWRFVKSLDLERMHAALPEGTLAAVPEPTAVTRDAEGRFYVCDQRNDCVLVLDAELGFERALGLGGLRRPTGLALSADGSRLLVVDAGAGRVLTIDLESGLIVIARVELEDGRLTRASWPFAAAPPEEPFALAPRLHGIARDRDGRLHVTDVWRDRVLTLSEDGELLRELGATGLGRVEFREPHGIALDGKGRLALIDHANHRMQVLTSGGAYASVLGSRPFIEPALREPSGEDEEEED